MKPRHMKPRYMKQGLLYSAALAAVLATSVPASAQLFGDSDEVKAARQKHEDDQDTQLAQLPQLQAQIRDLSERVRSLTDGLARVTGANEELSHQIAVANEKIESQRKDFAYRLCMVSAQQLGTDPSGLNCAAAGTQSAPRASSAPQSFSPGAPLPPLGTAQQNNSTYGGDDAPVRGRPPGNLGTLPSGPPPRSAAPPPVTTLDATGGDGRQFDAAMNLLAKAQYAEASAAFRAYAENHAEDSDLSPQALYWVADIAYVQQDYATAARVFAEQIKKYPTSARSPDSMLKIGQSLIAEGQTSGGCTALGAIKKQYPNAPASTLTAAANARKTACK